MNSLTELKDYLHQQNMRVNEFGGWYLKIGTDTWTLFDGVFHCNGIPQQIKDKKIFQKYSVYNDSKIVDRKVKKIMSARFTDRVI